MTPREPPTQPPDAERASGTGSSWIFRGWSRGCPTTSTSFRCPAWIRGAEYAQKRSEALDKISKLIGKHGLTEIFSKTDLERYKRFPFDGQALFRQRLDAAARDYPQHAKGLEEIRNVLRDAGPEPCPYLAVLACDGDNMGKFVKGMDLQQQTTFSESLSTFAGKARDVVEDVCYGSLVYAGGDDVLAFLPLDRALECARLLSEKFAESLDRHEVGAALPTLSIGMAVVHMLTPMRGDMIRHAYKAESHAKDPREEQLCEKELVDSAQRAIDAAKDRSGENKVPRGNAVAIHLHKRSGAPIKVRMPRGNGNETDPSQRMLDWIELLRKGDISDRTPFALSRLARDFVHPTTHKELAFVTPDLLRKEMLRVLKRKVQEGKELQEPWKSILASVSSVSDLDRVANEIIVARMFLRASQDAEGENR